MMILKCSVCCSAGWCCMKGVRGEGVPLAVRRPSAARSARASDQRCVETVRRLKQRTKNGADNGLAHGHELRATVPCERMAPDVVRARARCRPQLALSVLRGCRHSPLDASSRTAAVHADRRSFGAREKKKCFAKI